MMRVWMVFATATIFLSGLFSARALDDRETDTAQLKLKIDSILSERCLDPERSSVALLRVSGNRWIYQRQIDKALKPASLMKLFTTVGALSYLGGDYRFSADFLSSAPIADGELDGDLYIVGRGDPSLTPETLYAIATALKRRGIGRIKGDIALDTTFFDDRERPQSWGERPDASRAHSAPIGALSVNFNTVAIEIHADSGASPFARIESYPKVDYLKIVNQVKVAPPGARERKVTIKREARDGKLIITLSGRVARWDEPELRYVAVFDPARFAGESFRAVFDQIGLKVDGSIRIGGGKAPASARLIYRHWSAPLRELLGAMNRYSSNFLGEQIAKTIAAQINGAPGSSSDGAKLIERRAREFGVLDERSAAKLLDGSGLAPGNRVSAREIAELIARAARSFEIGPDFIASMPLMGREGSVVERLKNARSIKRSIRAKTGSLNGVSDIAGILASPEDDSLLAFVIMFNNNRCGAFAADLIEDRIIEAIYRYANAPETRPGLRSPAGAR